MTIGIQELVTLLFVVGIVGFAVYRRWRKKPGRRSGCADCADGPANEKSEKPIHIYRRRD